MNVMKITGRIAAVFAFLALVSVEASAQVPGLTASATGRSVTIEITPVPGSTGNRLAVGTDPGAANIATVNLPLSVTRIVVAAPDGTYYMRVAGLLGSLVGPNSADVRVEVSAAAPPTPCAPPAAPTVTATVTGLTVNVSWSGVNGASGYQVHWSRAPGATELVETTTSTSVSKYVGLPGTFYVRVVVLTTCGNATSNEASFTTVNVPGLRMPDPPLGQLLPVPAYAEGVINDMARRYPGELSRSCKNNHEWLFLLLRELRTRDARWGLNWKRGDRNQGMSSDIISYNPTSGPDQDNGQVYIFDVIGAECEQNYPTFNDVTQHTWAFRGDPACGPGTYCTKWTIEPYLRAGFPADQQ
jgi:hypothetical protein